jgi:hypothetical protein
VPFEPSCVFQNLWHRLWVNSRKKWYQKSHKPIFRVCIAGIYPNDLDETWLVTSVMKCAICGTHQLKDMHSAKSPNWLFTNWSWHGPDSNALHYCAGRWFRTDWIRLCSIICLLSIQKMRECIDVQSTMNKCNQTVIVMLTASKNVCNGSLTASHHLPSESCIPEHPLELQHSPVATYLCCTDFSQIMTLVRNKEKNI